MRDTLAALGFEIKPITATTLTTALTPDVDVLVVGATLNPTTLNAANRAALDAFLARGGGVVGLGTAGSAFTTNAGLLTATGTSGASLASGVVNVVNNGGPVTNGAQSTAWVFPPVWYSNLGANAVVEQSYGDRPADLRLVAEDGHQRPRPAPPARRASSAGRAPAATASVLIGTSDGHASARQGPAGAARPRDLLGGRAEGDRRVDLDRGRRGGTVPATLALTLGAPASFGAFTPGVAKDYTAVDRRRP